MIKKCNFVFNKCRGGMLKSGIVEKKKFTYFRNSSELRLNIERLSPIFKNVKHVGTSLYFSIRQNNKAGLYNYSLRFITSFILPNNLLISNVENHFFSNILTRVSRTLALSANRFRSRQVNFVY